MFVPNRVSLVQDYKQESLRRLIELDTLLDSTGTSASLNPQITPAARDHLIECVVSLADTFNLSLESLQLSISLIDKLLNSYQVQKGSLPLLGTVCLLLGAKTHDHNPVSLSMALRVTNNAYKLEDFIAIELVVLEQVGWSLCIPTAAELSRQLVYITGVAYDFSNVLGRSDSFALICYQDYGLAHYSPLVVAIVSVVCALEQFRQFSFRSQWLRLLNDKIPIELVVLDECKRNLVNKLYSLTPHEGLHSLRELLGESISQVINS